MKHRRLAVLVACALVLLPALAWAEPSGFDALRAKGWIWAYLGVFVAGVGTSLTPCVYPMITITVAIFGARDAKSTAGAFGLASMYVAGMVVMYASLGVICALAGKQSGSGYLLSNPWVVIPIVVLYVALAASMFGLYELQLPQALQSRLSTVGGKGWVGAFLMGLVGGLTAAPCTGPLLVGLLLFVGQSGSVSLGFSLMTTYALGMGLLFIVIATFAMRLPKSGPWMEVVKTIGGVALLGVGAYFLRAIWPALVRASSPSDEFLIAAIVITTTGLALVGAYIKLYGRRAGTFAKVGGIILTTVGTIGVINWWLTPKHEIEWRTDRNVALADARTQERPVLLDFSAKWCGPCKLFETDVLSDLAVHAEVEARFVPVKFDVSDDSDADEADKTAWNAAALPTIILLGPDGKERKRYLGEPPTANEFLADIQAIR